MLPVVDGAKFDLFEFLVSFVALRDVMQEMILLFAQLEWACPSRSSC